MGRVTPARSARDASVSASLPLSRTISRATASSCARRSVLERRLLASVRACFEATWIPFARKLAPPHLGRAKPTKRNLRLDAGAPRPQPTNRNLQFVANRRESHDGQRTGIRSDHRGFWHGGRSHGAHAP